VTVRAGDDALLSDRCRHPTHTPVIVPRLTLLARLFLFCFWLVHIRIDKLRERRLLLFRFLDACQCLAESFSPLLVFCSKVSDFFLLGQGLRLPERSRLNSYACRTQGSLTLARAACRRYGQEHGNKRPGDAGSCV
jgi:hypothetical protein